MPCAAYIASRIADGAHSDSKFAYVAHWPWMQFFYRRAAWVWLSASVSANLLWILLLCLCEYSYNWDFAWTERRAFWVSIGLAVFSDAERFLGAVLVSISELRHWGPERARPENLTNGSSMVFGLRIGSRDSDFRTGDRFAAEEKILCLMAPVCFRIVRPSKSNLFRESHFNAHFVYISKLGPPLLKKGTRFGSKRRTRAGRSFGALTDTLGQNTLRTNSFLFSFQGLGRTQLRLS